MQIQKSIWVLFILAIATVGIILLHKQLTNFSSSWHSSESLPHLTQNNQKITTLNKKNENPITIKQQPKISPKIENNSPVKTSQVVPPINLSPEQLIKHIQVLAKERYTQSDRRRARNYILEVLKASGWSPTLQSFEGGINIIARRTGTDLQAGKILLAAHYDTVKNSPGADDNASGVATVLEVARVLGKRLTPRTLEIVFFDLEERGLLGSFAFTNQAENLVNLQGVIILDMVGFACHTPGCQRYPQSLKITPPSDKGDFLAVAGDSEHLPLLNIFTQSHQPNLPPVITLAIPLKGLATPDILRSDHAPFWYKGIGAVFVTDTADFRTPHYHQPSDKLETIDRKFLLGAATIVANATATLLESQESL